MRLLNVLPMTPVMLAEYVPADFDSQQRQTSEEALAIVARESGIEQSRISGVVRKCGIYHEILEEAAAIKATVQHAVGVQLSRSRGRSNSRRTTSRSAGRNGFHRPPRSSYVFMSVISTPISFAGGSVMRILFAS